MDAFEGLRALLSTKPFQRHNAAFVASDGGPKDHLLRMLASAHHQSSSCRMGSDPKTSVADASLRVHGYENLMIADSSIFPDTTMHNPNLTCYVVGERVAEIVKAARV